MKTLRLLKATFIGVVGIAGAQCVIPPFDAAGKRCAVDTDCPSPLRCTPDTEGTPRCATASTPPDGGAGRWQPSAGLSWQIQLTTPLDVSVDASVYAVDLNLTDSSTIAQLHALNRRVICRLSAGAGDTTQPAVAALPQAAVGNAAPDNLHWLDIRHAAVRTLMANAFAAARTKGCDAVDPTHLDGYQASTGFSLTEQDSVTFLTNLATDAHAIDLSIGLDNAVELGTRVASVVDWAMNESCVKYSECNQLTAFSQLNKPVFHYEFADAQNLSSVCDVTGPLGFSSILKRLSLDAWQVRCP